jgi:hypothetical protein
MTTPRIFQWAAFVLVAGAVSVPLALKEGIAYQFGFLNGTPGLVVASRLVSPRSERGFEAMTKAGNVMLAVDAPLCFALICGTGAIIVGIRRRRRMRTPVKTN